MPLCVRRESLQSRVASVRGSIVQITPAARDKKKKQLLLYRELWQKRKRQCNEVLSSLADGMDKKVRDLEIAIGIETDEASGVQFPSPQGAKSTAHAHVRAAGVIAGKRSS